MLDALSKTTESTSAGMTSFSKGDTAESAHMSELEEINDLLDEVTARLRALPAQDSNEDSDIPRRIDVFLSANEQSSDEEVPSAVRSERRGRTRRRPRTQSSLGEYPPAADPLVDSPEPQYSRSPSVRDVNASILASLPSGRMRPLSSTASSTSSEDASPIPSRHMSPLRQSHPRVPSAPHPSTWGTMRISHPPASPSSSSATITSTTASTSGDNPRGLCPSPCPLMTNDSSSTYSSTSDTDSNDPNTNDQGARVRSMRTIVPWPTTSKEALYPPTSSESPDSSDSSYSSDSSESSD